MDLRMDRTDTANGIGEGIAIFVKDGLEILPCDNTSLLNQYCKFSINAYGEELFFYVIYRPPSGGPVSKLDLGEMIKNVEK
jgi:hypothetical protein